MKRSTAQRGAAIALAAALIPVITAALGRLSAAGELGASALDYLAVAASVAFLAATVFGITLVASLRRLWLGALVGSVLSGLASGVSAGALMFRVRSNTDPDAELLIDGIERGVELLPMFWSEASAVHWALAIGVVVVALGLPWLALMREAPKWAKWPTGLTAAIVTGLLVVVGCTVSAWGHGQQAKQGIVPAPTRVLLTLLLPQKDSQVQDVVLLAPELQLENSEARRSNVVFLLLESTRARSTSVHSELSTTPFLKQLATQQGRYVERGYGTVTHTSKGVVGALCGIFPRPAGTEGAVPEALEGGLPRPCLPKLLATEGYATAFFQTASNHFESRDRLVANMGFEEFFGRNDLSSEGFEVTNYFGPEDDVMIEPAVRWAKAQERPFLLTALTVVPHSDYRTPSNFPIEQYSEDRKLNAYLNALRYQDRFVEKLFTRLQEEGLMEDTIFVLVGDHGEGFREHGKRVHDLVIWEEGVRVPIVIGGPGTGDPGTPITGLRQSTDLTPSVLDALGFQYEQDVFDGRTLFDDPHDSLFVSCFYGRRCAAIVEGDNKYITHFGRKPIEAYDLSSDSLEASNIAPELEPSERQRYERMVDAWLERIDSGFAVGREAAIARFVSADRPSSENVLNTRLGDELLVVGVDGVPSRARAGDPIPLRISFEALSSDLDDATVFVHILKPDGHRFRRLDHEVMAGFYPLSSWRRGEFVTDVHRFGLPVHMPPGEYSIRFGFWRDRARVGVTHPGTAEVIDDAISLPIVVEPYEGPRRD